MISVSEAARATGLNEQTIRLMCKNEVLGTALRTKGVKGKRYKYIVSPAKLREWLGTN